MRDSQVSHFYVTTPLCRVAVVFGKDPFSLKRFDLFADQDRLIEALDTGPEVDIFDHPAAKLIMSNLDAFFAGRPKSPPWDIFSFEGLTSLQIKVLHAAAQIAFGTVTTYSRLAEMAEVPGAARFVGTALSRNPFPILIPCHRVIRKDGGIGGFSAGADIKLELIEFEQKVLSLQLP
ncbi:MAG: methylated-DNA--[protein]-cysteine S-methyltransferase [Deltaproteobacteria bacterium]|nr:methylated-DNA--[protein]-cysteine S-methyltransferase [Deltaproteobacteria bacterium]